MSHNQELILTEAEINNAIMKVIPEELNNENIIFVCIGTDRSTGDGLAPMVGTFLEKMGYTNIIGTLDDPCHAMNLEEIVSSLPVDKKIIAIDAALGSANSIGKFYIRKGYIKAGAGVGKNLPPVGDYSITSVVNVGGFMEYFVLQNTRLSLIYNLAETISKAILHRFPLRSLAEVAVSI